MFEKITQTLKEKWNLKLYEEYHSILYQYGLKNQLKCPNIILSNNMSHFGLWDSAKRTIFIAEDLIRKYSWSLVLQVLKHEIAHQIVSDLFHENDGHGPLFLKACEMIGVEKNFQKSSISVDEKFVHWKNQTVEAEEEGLLKKIEKLLSLAQSSNEHESALAMAKVQELYEKYNLEKLSHHQRQNYVTLTINFKKKIIPTTHSIAANILLNHFFVKIVFSSLYDATLDEVHQTFDIMGTKQNVLMAEYVFYFLIERIEILWKNYSAEQKLTFKYKRSYQQGILTGFYKKLDESKQVRQASFRKEDQKNLLMTLHDPYLKDFVRSKYPKLSSKGGSSGGVYTEHYKNGLEDGKKLTLNKPMSENKNGQRKLLGASRFG